MPVYQIDTARVISTARSSIHDTRTVWSTVTGTIDADPATLAASGAVAELVDQANRHGGTDNITTLLLQCLAA